MNRFLDLPLHAATWCHVTSPRISRNILKRTLKCRMGWSNITLHDGHDYYVPSLNLKRFFLGWNNTLWWWSFVARSMSKMNSLSWSLKVSMLQKWHYLMGFESRVEQEHMNLFYDRGKHKMKKEFEKWYWKMNFRDEFERRIREMKLRYETEKWFAKWNWNMILKTDEFEKCYMNDEI